MSINVTNIRYFEILGSGNVTKKLNSGKIVNATNITGEKTSKEMLGFSVSISKESKAKLRQLNLEKMQRDLDFQSGEKSSNIDSSNLKEGTAEIVKHILLDVTENTEDYTYFTWMYKASKKTWEDGEGGTVGYTCLSGVVSAYAEMRKEIQSQYTGEELEKHLKMLDDDYDKAMESVSESISNTLRFFAAIKQEPAGPWNDIFKKMNIDYSKTSYMDNVDAFLKTLRDSLIHYGKLSKQYILDGNEAPNTEEGRKDFVDYVKRNVESNDNIFSLDDLEEFFK